MDEDPDDLAALFFANQASKEKQKATLPTDDWVKVVEAVLKKRKLRGSNTLDVSTSDGIDTNDNCNGQKSSDKIDASTWIVTTMPPTPNKQNVNGIDGIMLDTSNTNCSSGSTSISNKQCELGCT